MKRICSVSGLFLLALLIHGIILSAIVFFMIRRGTSLKASRDQLGNIHKSSVSRPFDSVAQGKFGGPHLPTDPFVEGTSRLDIGTSTAGQTQAATRQSSHEEVQSPEDGRMKGVAEQEPLDTTSPTPSEAADSLVDSSTQIPPEDNPPSSTENGLYKGEEPGEAKHASSLPLPARLPRKKDQTSYTEYLRSVLDPSKRYLAVKFYGRLGNVLFELASSYCIAQLNNLTLVIENASETSHLQFQGIRIPKLAWKYLDTVIPIQGLPSGLCCVFKEELLHVPASNTSFKMGGYFQSWKYFEHCEETVKKALAFKEDVVIKARRYVREWRDRFPNRTLVGMHVRLEDYLAPKAVRNGKRIAPPDYYLRAMTYFRERFPNVTFVLFASDPDAFKANVTNPSDMVVAGRSEMPEIDMEILSTLDHLICSVGTFGWWAGYKSRGTVVSYKHFFIPGSRYGLQFAAGTQYFFYPGWIQM